MIRVAITTLLTLLSGTLAFAQIRHEDEMAAWREQRKAKLAAQEHSPLKTEKALAKLSYYPADSAYRVVATVRLLTDAPPIKVKYALYGVPAGEIRPYALLSFSLRNQPYVLTVYQNVPESGELVRDERLSLSFKDATSGKKTYGGGRWLDISADDLQYNTVLLDFNKAHNQLCAYAKNIFCPIPPRTNWLAVAIEAGEMKYGGR
jgi:uncharacterized protein